MATTPRRCLPFVDDTRLIPVKSELGTSTVSIATNCATSSNLGSNAGSVSDEVAGQASGRRRRHPTEVDELRARMLLQGFPLPDLTPKENERLFSSLLHRRRLPLVLARAGFDEQDYTYALDRLRQQRRRQQRQ